MSLLSIVSGDILILVINFHIIKTSTIKIFIHLYGLGGKIKREQTLSVNVIYNCFIHLAFD